jgi:uncharacterized protein (TIGR02391 family)
VKHPAAFTSGQLEALCKALADMATGLTGTEIGHALASIRVADPEPTGTKWRRLFNALAARQNTDGHGDRVLAFIHAALDPARYAGRRESFDTRRRAANVPLAFYGLEYGEDGKFRPCKPATTLSEAEQRADRLRTHLEQRGVEPAVLDFCRAELLADNYFHAVLEATKSVAALIRERTALTSDGATLVQAAFGGDDPPLRLNAFRTETDKGEQRGLANLMVGFFGTFRNPTAHAARVEWPINEQDALDLLSLASYLHRRIKAAAHR